MAFVSVDTRSTIVVQPEAVPAGGLSAIDLEVVPIVATIQAKSLLSDQLVPATETNFVFTVATSA